MLRYLGNRKDCKVWRQNTGSVAGIVSRIEAALRDAGLNSSAVAVARVASKLGLHMSFGVPGCADVSGLMSPTGRRLEIECKSETGRQSEAQRNFQAMIEAMGGLYLLVRRVEDLYPWFPPASD